jgi:hypothetical protein
MGEAAYYGWAAGKDRIEGPSQALAYAAARCWGNCAVDQQPIEETPDAWVFTSVFVDCETGFTLTRKFRQSKKWTVHGKLDAERKDDVRFQIGQTKGDRNVILKALPKWLIDKAMEEAKAGVRLKLENYIANHGMSAAIDYAVKELAKSGVDETRVCAKFSVAKKSALSLDNLVIIAGDIKAIQQGQEYPEELYPIDEAADIAGQLTGGKKKQATASKDAEQEKTVAAPLTEPTDPPEVDCAFLFAEFCESLQQAESVDAVRKLQTEYAKSWNVEYTANAQAKAEMRIADLSPKHARGERAQKTLV